MGLWAYGMRILGLHRGIVVLWDCGPTMLFGGGRRGEGDRLCHRLAGDRMRP